MRDSNEQAGLLAEAVGSAVASLVRYSLRFMPLQHVINKQVPHRMSRVSPHAPGNTVHDDMCVEPGMREDDSAQERLRAASTTVQVARDCAQFLAACRTRW